MRPTPFHINHVLVFFYKSGIDHTEATAKIRQTYGSQIIPDYYAQVWYKRFDAGQFNLSEEVIPPSPMSSLPSVDIIADVLSRFNRQQIEKCRLINKHFRDSINSLWNTLPLYRFDRLRSDRDVIILEENSDKKVGIKKEDVKLIRRLKDIAFERIVVRSESCRSVFGERYYYAKNIDEEMLAHIYDTIKEPLKVNYLTMVLPSESILQNYKTYLNFQEVYFRFSSYTKFHMAWLYITDLPSTLNDVFISVRSLADYNDEWSLMSFLTMLEHGRRYNLCLKPKLIEGRKIFGIFRKIIEMFEQSNEPESMFKSVGLGRVHCNAASLDEFEQLLFTKQFTIVSKESRYNRPNQDQGFRPRAFVAEIKNRNCTLEIKMDIHSWACKNHSYDSSYSDESEHDELLCDLDANILIDKNVD